MTPDRIVNAGSRRFHHGFAPLIEVGHRYIKSLSLTSDQQATLRANFIEHRTYGRDKAIKSSIFRDNGEVCAALGMPEREEGS